MEMRCYREIQRISNKDHVTNEEVCTKQDPAGNRTTRRPPDHGKETQTAVLWTCHSFTRSRQNHLARHSERGKEDEADKKRWEGNIRERTGLEFAKS